MRLRKQIKEEHNNNLDDLNDLIKSHLLPISEAAIEKYRDYFQVKKIVSLNLKRLPLSN